jgi:hypothetical protein
VKLPADVVIAQEKLRYYLLLPREENDKSKLLATVGYTLANWETLDHDLRQLAIAQDISNTEPSLYGTKYEVCGQLRGPNGRTLPVVTVWITLHATGETRLVTLFPDRRARQ